MTRDNALWICELIRDRDAKTDAEVDALNIAIEALEQEPIIHCKDCKYWHKWENGTGSCHRSNSIWVGTDYYDYCSYGEREEE